jgi:hypothetical protein
MIKEREFSFSIQIEPPKGKTIYLSAESEEDGYEWRDAVAGIANPKEREKSRTPEKTNIQNPETPPKQKNKKILEKISSKI